MSNFSDLTLKVEKIIKEERDINPDIQYLNPSHASIIAQIISNYKLPSKSEISLESKPQADMLFIGAPTGAGKDTLVRKIMLDNSEKKFVVLNMDMFRYYHYEILETPDQILDKDFAIKTNQTSYELYYIIQEIILREFPGTHVMVTGTIKDLEWVKQIVRRYKKDPNTQYYTSLVALAVPEKESAFSIFERYLNLVDTRDSKKTPLRYTELSYHNDTIKDFILNIGYFEGKLSSKDEDSLFDSIKVYRRNKDMYDLSENTLIYDSENSNSGNTAVSSINQIMNSKQTIDNFRVDQLLDIIKRNTDYLKSQGLYKSILHNLIEIVPQLDKTPDFEDIEK